MDPRIADVIARMEQHLEEDLSIADLAAAVHLSPSRLAHLFKRQTGISPARYLHALRMQRARALLERTFLSVKQVMTAVGVHDPSHFARDFRRCHGVGPSELRQRRWGVHRDRAPSGGGDPINERNPLSLIPKPPSDLHPEPAS